MGVLRSMPAMTKICRERRDRKHPFRDVWRDNGEKTNTIRRYGLICAGYLNGYSRDLAPDSEEISMAMWGAKIKSMGNYKRKKSVPPSAFVKNIMTPLTLQDIWEILNDWPGLLGQC